MHARPNRNLLNFYTSSWVMATNQFLVRFVQQHPTFRCSELESCALLSCCQVKQPLDFVEYDDASPFAILELNAETDPAALVKRSILTQSVYELWGCGSSYEELHKDVIARTKNRWADFMQVSFCFKIDCFNHTRTMSEQRDIVESFSYMDFQGPIRLRDAEQIFTVHELWSLTEPKELLRLYLGRYLGNGGRELMNAYDLKRRHYVGNTSFEAELSLVTANQALAQPGMLIYDPFCGTGSFLYTCSHFGAVTFGSDIGCLSVLGRLTNCQTDGICVEKVEDLDSYFLDTMTFDLTQSPIRHDVLFDAIVCDPPYGVRAGAKRLGSKKDMSKPVTRSDGAIAHMQPDFVFPTVAYELSDVLNDLMEFSARHLRPEGRLVFWLPVIRDLTYEPRFPQHPQLRLISNCEQPFSQWSRNLLTYLRIKDAKSSSLADKTIPRKNCPEFRDLYFNKDLRNGLVIPGGMSYGQGAGQV